MAWSSPTGWNARAGWSQVASGAPHASFVNASGYNLAGASDSAIPVPSGAATGDILAVELFEASAFNTTTLTANGSGVALTIGSGPDVVPGASGYAYLFWKVLTAGDISNGHLTVANAATQDPLIMSLYRSPTTLTVKNFQQPGGATTTFPGFAPDVATLGVGASFINTGAPGALTLTASTGGWTQRYGGPTSVAFFGGAVVDRLSGYTNTSVGFSTFGGFVVAGYIYEFT